MGDDTLLRAVDDRDFVRLEHVDEDAICLEDRLRGGRALYTTPA